MSDGQSTPTGVKVIAVLYYIGAFFGILFGIIFIVGAGMMSFIATQIPLFGVIGTGLFLLGGIIMIGFGVLGFFIGRGLWRAERWARNVAIIFSFLAILMAVISMIQGEILFSAFNLVIQLVVVLYLLFSSNVKQAFA